jgi:DMSO/TMAO reductase YedYZ molybdopterin-dependent catalytic subunit
LPADSAKAGPRDRVPPGQAEVDDFPVLTYGATPRVPQEQYRVRVWGLAGPRDFSWADLMALPQTELECDIHCVTRWSKLGTRWRGIKVADLVADLEIDPGATHALAHCYGGYTTNLPLPDLLEPTSLLAHTYDGQPLERDHGGPLRLLVPHLYLWKSAKWVNGLEFMAHDKAGFWERNGYHMYGDPWREERFS